MFSNIIYIFYISSKKVKNVNFRTFAAPINKVKLIKMSLTSRMEKLSIKPNPENTSFSINVDVTNVNVKADDIKVNDVSTRVKCCTDAVVNLNSFQNKASSSLRPITTTLES